MGDKLNVVLAKVQALGPQIHSMYGGGMEVNAKNTEGPNWNLQDQNMDGKPAPQSIPLQGEKHPVSPADVNLRKNQQQHSSHLVQ